MRPGSLTGSSGGKREAGMEAGAQIALTQLGGCGGTARLVTRGGAKGGQEVRPVRLYWELLAELVQESRSTLRSSSVCEKVLTSWRASMMADQRSPRPPPPSPPPPRRSWKGGRRREITGDVPSGAEWGRSGGDSPVQVSAPPTNFETLQKINADVSNRKQVLQNFLLVPEVELLLNQLPTIKECVSVCVGVGVCVGVASAHMSDVFCCSADSCSLCNH